MSFTIDIPEESSFSCKRKPKDVTTQMKVLDESVQMVLFVLVLKRVHFHANET